MTELEGSEGLGGKVVLVTGGSRGIGAAISTHLARAGADVALTYVQAKVRADDVVAAVEAQGRRAVAIRADAADPDAVVAAVDEAARRLGRLDVLVNNAGIAPYGPLDEVTLADVDITLAVHVRAAFLAAQAAARHMGEGGRIISIGSNVAQKVPYAGFTLYTMSKAALVGLTKGLAHDLAGRGITANLVAPGSTDTDMNPADGPTADAERALIPLGRYCDPADVAAAVTFLAGAGARSITGATITVDGGATVMAWVLLVVAALLEPVWAVALERSDGFRHPGPAALGVSAATASFVLLSLSLRQLPVGTAYAVWVGIGVTCVAAVGMLALGEDASPLRLVFLAAIVVGVAGLRFLDA